MYLIILFTYILILTINLCIKNIRDMKALEENVRIIQEDHKKHNNKTPTKKRGRTRLISSIINEDTCMYSMLRELKPQFLFPFETLLQISNAIFGLIRFPPSKAYSIGFIKGFSSLKNKSLCFSNNSHKITS